MRVNTAGTPHMSRAIPGEPVPDEKDPGISIVFPAFNEEMNICKTLGQTVRTLPGFTKNWEAIVVDDGSTDGTAALVESFCGEFKNIRLIRHGANLGYGAALKSGIAAAKKDLVFFCDSDMQFDIAEIGGLLDWVDSFDIVAGYRMRRQDPFHRKLNAFGWNMLVRRLLGLKVRDVDCAFKLFRRSVFDRITISAMGAMVNTDILAQAAKNGNSIKEVGVHHYPRLHGAQTGANAKVVLRAFSELIGLYRKLKERRSCRRVDRTLSYKFSGKGNELQEGMVNISERGARIKTGIGCNPEDIVHILIFNGSGPINTPARVLRVNGAGAGREVALKFMRLKRQTVIALRQLTVQH